MNKKELQNRYVVIGASSKIGKIFYSKFKKKIKFASKNNSKRNDLKKFDINKDEINYLISKFDPTHIIIFSAESDPDKCFKYPKKTMRTNYYSIKKIIMKCVKRNIVPIVFSTEFVFNGRKGNYLENSKTNPILTYGYQKELLEKFILNKKLPALIFRLSKVYGSKKNDNTLITNFIKQIRKKKNIKVAKDQIFTPIYDEDLANVIDIAATKKMTGLYNLSGNERLSRYEILRKIIKIFNSKTEITKCSLDDFKLPEKRPKDVSLSNKLLKNRLNYKFKNINFVINKIKKLN